MITFRPLTRVYGVPVTDRGLCYSPVTQEGIRQVEILVLVLIFEWTGQMKDEICLLWDSDVLRRNQGKAIGKAIVPG